MRTCFSLGAQFSGMVNLCVLDTHRRFSALSVRARVCACIGVSRGIDARSIAVLVGLSYDSVISALHVLVSEGIVNKHRDGQTVRYHDTKEARRIVRSELEQLDKTAVDLINGFRVHPRIKQGKLDRLLGIVPDVE